MIAKRVPSQESSATNEDDFIISYYKYCADKPISELEQFKNLFDRRVTTDGGVIALKTTGRPLMNAKWFHATGLLIADDLDTIEIIHNGVFGCIMKYKTEKLKKMTHALMLVLDRDGSGKVVAINHGIYYKWKDGNFAGKSIIMPDQLDSFEFDEEE